MKTIFFMKICLSHVSGQRCFSYNCIRDSCGCSLCKYFVSIYSGAKPRAIHNQFVIMPQFKVWKLRRPLLFSE